MCAAGGDQFGKTGEQHSADHLTKGSREWREIDHLIRGVGGMNMSQGDKGTKTGGRSCRRSKRLTTPTSHEAGRARAVKELNNPHCDEGADLWNTTCSDCEVLVLNFQRGVSHGRSLWAKVPSRIFFVTASGGGCRVLSSELRKINTATVPECWGSTETHLYVFARLMF